MKEKLEKVNKISFRFSRYARALAPDHIKSTRAEKEVPTGAPINIYPILMPKKSGGVSLITLDVGC